MGIVRQELDQFIRQVDRAVDVLSLRVLTIPAVLQRGLERAERADRGRVSAPPVQLLSGIAEENKDREVACDEVVLDLDHDAPLAADRGFA